MRGVAPFLDGSVSQDSHACFPLQTTFCVFSKYERRAHPSFVVCEQWLELVYEISLSSRNSAFHRLMWERYKHKREANLVPDPFRSQQPTGV